MYYLLSFLTGGGYNLRGEYIPREVDSLIDHNRFDEQILSLNSQLATFKLTLRWKQTAKASLFSTLEDPTAD